MIRTPPTRTIPDSKIHAIKNFLFLTEWMISSLNAYTANINTAYPKISPNKLTMTYLHPYIRYLALMHDNLSHITLIILRTALNFPERIHLRYPSIRAISTNYHQMHPRNHHHWYRNPLMPQIHLYFFYHCLEQSNHQTVPSHHQ